jgi:hypothetical protein
MSIASPIVLMKPCRYCRTWRQARWWFGTAFAVAATQKLPTVVHHENHIKAESNFSANCITMGGRVTFRYCTKMALIGFPSDLQPFPQRRARHCT